MVSELTFSENIAQEIAMNVNGVKIPSDDKSRIAGALFDIVHEHHLAVLLLIRKKHYGSAGTLLRSIFEAYVRGVWFLKCANSNDVDLFVKKDKFRDGIFQDRLDDLQEVNEGGFEGLSIIKKQSWNALNSYAHGGYRPVGRRLLEDEIAANYTECEINEIERLADAFSILAALQIAELSKSTNLLSVSEGLARKFDEKHS